MLETISHRGRAGREIIDREGATLGAGTTLTKSAPPGSLTVSRAKQLSIDGWQRPRKSRKD